MDWLLAPFSGCEVPVEAVEASASLGDWSILKYLRDHDAGNRPPGQEEELSTRAGNVVRWNTPKVLAHAIEQGFPNDALWLLDFEPLRQHQRAVRNSIPKLLQLDMVEFAESLLPDGKYFLSSQEYALLCTDIPRTVERMLDTGYLNQHEKVGAAAILDLVDTERLDLMQRVASTKYSPLQHSKRWKDVWKDAVMRACSRSNVEIVRWLISHPIGQEACKSLKEENNLSCLLQNAAERGDIAMMRCLEGLGAFDKYRDALLLAVSKDDRVSAKWLLGHLPQSEHIPDYCVLHEAAVNGHLGMIQFLHGLGSVPGFHSVSARPSHDDQTDTSQREACTVSHFKRIGLQLCWGEV